MKFGVVRSGVLIAALIGFNVIAGSYIFKRGIYSKSHENHQQSSQRTRALRAAKPETHLEPLLRHNETDPWKIEHYGRLDRVRRKCGRLCSINDMDAYETQGRHKPGNAYSTFTAPVDCRALFEADELDAGDQTVPYPLPKELLDWYSLKGGIAVRDVKKYGDQLYLSSQAQENVWEEERIQRDLKLLAAGELEGTYKVKHTNLIRDRLLEVMGDTLKGKAVLVVGSQRPWLETLALYAGAANVTTLEYGAIKSKHPKVFTITPYQFRQRYLNGALPQYDAVLSFSSLEHSGLGRYGDALNPWGDILSLARVWCATKSNGMLMLGLPKGGDSVEFNAHRVYGNIRWPLITTNWSPADGTKNYEAGVWGPLGLHGLHFFRKVDARSSSLMEQ